MILPIILFFFFNQIKNIPAKIAINGMRNIPLLAYHGEKEEKNKKGIIIDRTKKVSSFLFLLRIDKK